MILIGTPHTKGAGYFVNNQALRTREEGDVQTCAHCGKVLIMQRWKEEGGWCAREMKPVCLTCADKALTHGCEPMMKQIERHMEQQMRFLKRGDMPVAAPLILTGSKG